MTWPPCWITLSWLHWIISSVRIWIGLLVGDSPSLALCLLQQPQPLDSSFEWRLWLFLVTVKLLFCLMRMTKDHVTRMIIVIIVAKQTCVYHCIFVEFVLNLYYISIEFVLWFVWDGRTFPGEAKRRLVICLHWHRKWWLGSHHSPNWVQVEVCLGVQAGEHERLGAWKIGPGMRVSVTDGVWIHKTQSGPRSGGHVATITQSTTDICSETLGKICIFTFCISLGIALVHLILSCINL